MPRTLDNRYIIDVTINGSPVDWTQFALEELNIHESVKQRYPTGEMSYACTHEYILNNPVVDASAIIVTVEDTQAQPPTPPITYRMRAFNSKFKALSQAFKGYVSLYLDALDLHQARIKSYGQVTSSEAISAAATDAGLEPEVDPSADSQYWIRPNTRGADFIYKTGKHSYASETSCFITAIFADHRLRHYDLTQRRQSGPQWIFTNRLQEYTPPAGNEVIYEDAQFSIVSGTTNSYAGYGQVSGTYHLEKGFQFYVTNITSLFTGAANVQKAMLGSQRAQTLPYDSDNTHENYVQSAIQNKVIKAMFSSKVDVKTRFGRLVPLLDYVELRPYAMPLNNITGGIITTWAGNYFVSEIHTLITPAAVGKHYVLIREGLDSMPGGLGLLGGGGGGAVGGGDA